MEAVPRLPMINFELKVSTENVQFGPQLKQYIANYYNEDPEAYNTEVSNLEALRAAAVRPTIDVSGCQLLKKYYCQLHFLKSRFPMQEMEAAAVYFAWKDTYTNMPCGLPDIRFELMCVLYNIGALHSQLGALDARTSPDGMKMACTHFQCAAWAFQTVKETYHQMVPYITTLQVVHFMQQVCLAQAQECILEKSMMDNRKATIIAKVAVQVVDYYKRSLSIIQTQNEESSLTELVGSRNYKEWVKYLLFKISYHKCIALLFQGQQAEEQQKMGERVAFYQAASDQLEEARKLSTSLKQPKDIAEALAFTSDVVEGKRKAAKNENEFIYHEEVPEKHALQEVRGASLVKGIPFNVNDVEVSGPDIFGRLVPMEAHEAASLYSERKAEMLRNLGELIESKDQALAEFMSSLQLDVFNQMRQATGLSQDLVDRAAALSAKPNATQDLVGAMGKLSNSYHEVEAMLNEIQELLKEEDQNEKEYQDLMGKRPPSIIATDLSREAAKYREAHNKANDSNQNLHKAMTTHVANLKILAQPLMELQKQIPAVEFPNPNIDENSVKEIENLIAKVDEMRSQRAMLWNQLREAVHKDDITSVLITRHTEVPLDHLFTEGLEKHKEIVKLIEQNAAAQENILKAFVDAYARSTSTRRYLQEVISKRNTTVSALIASCDSYEDLLAKANKGIEFYNKLETNVSKLLQRIKSASKVQQEEREQILLKNSVPKIDDSVQLPKANTAPKLKDYLESRKKMNSQYYQPSVTPEAQNWPTSIRPAPLGSEVNSDTNVAKVQEPNTNKAGYGAMYQDQKQYPGYNYQDQALAHRFANLATNQQYSSYIPDNYSGVNYGNYQATTALPAVSQPSAVNNKQAPTVTTDTYQPILSHTPNSQVAPDHHSINCTSSSSSLPSFNPPSLNVEAYTTPTTQPNVYYPSGYGPNTQQQLPSNQTYNYPTNFGNVEYATSVRPDILNNYNYNYTYSSPTVDLKSSNSDQNVAGYDQSYYANYYGYAPQSTVDAVNYNHAIDDTSYQYNTIAPNYGYSATQVQQPSIDSSQTQIADTSTYPTQQQSYGYNYPASTTPQLPSGYDSTLHQQNGYSYGVSSTPQQPSASSYGYATQVPVSSYGYIAPSPQQPGYDYTTPTTAPQSQPVTNKQSNVDLLSGLDFNVSQAPLIPQQKPSSNDIKNVTSSGTVPVESKKAELAKKDVIISNKDDSIQIVKPEKIVNRKPLTNSELKKLLTNEVDKFEKNVDVLNNKTLSGPTNLDLKWKEIQDKQDCDKKAISVARCYPMKNRFPDILPYDYSRVELKAAKDDYINASHIVDISYYAAPLIVTQAPLTSTFNDFWTMIREQQVELIICLLGDSEINNEIYWPLEKGRDLHFEGMVISLVSKTAKPHWTERLITISVPEKRDSRVVMHLQFTSWPGSLFPTSPQNFTGFITEVVNLFMQQRNTSHPIVVHCSSGIGRSGLACLLITAILEMTNNATSIPDLVSLTVKLAAARKNILRDREHLKFAYEALLCYMKQVITQGQGKRGLNEVAANGFEEKRTESIPETVKDDDPLSSLDPFWASKK